MLTLEITQTTAYGLSGILHSPDKWEWFTKQPKELRDSEDMEWILPLIGNRISADAFPINFSKDMIKSIVSQFENVTIKEEAIA